MWKWIPIKFLLAVAVAAIAVVVYLIHFFQKQGFTNKETTTMSIKCFDANMVHGQKHL